MANQLSMVQVHTIESLHKAGYSNRRIARTLGVDRGTVNKCVRSLKSQATQPAASADLSDRASSQGDGPVSITDVAAKCHKSEAHRSGRRSCCDGYRELIAAKLEQGLSATRIHRDLQTDHDFTGSYYSVRRFVKLLESKTPLPFRRLETEPGEEAQIDFGTAAYVTDADGKQRRPWMLRVVLSYSRKAYSEVVWRQTTDNFIAVLENAFHHFGGVPKQLVIDNLKAAVARADWYDPELHPKLQSFARHYGAAFVPTVDRGVELG